MHLKGLTPAGISAPRLRFKRRPVTGSSQGGSVLTAGTLKGGVRLEHNANTGRDKDGPRREEKSTSLAHTESKHLHMTTQLRGLLCCDLIS